MTRNGKFVSIENTANEGLSGIELIITLNPQLKIVDAEFHRWNDMIDDYETNYRIEKIKFEVDRNPFIDSMTTGRYSAQICNRVRTNKSIRKLGIKDTTYITTFKGKFKLYR